MSTRIVVGLGNPGQRYAQNRHNIGFWVVDALADALGAGAFAKKFSGLYAKAADVVLLKPTTFMNVSGDSVQPACAFFRVPAAELIVVHDELDLPFGEVRIKVGGGHAGHNGLRSIQERMGSNAFVRVRVGIGRPPADFRGDVADYVLSDFSADERAELDDVVRRALEATRLILERGPKDAMNELHGDAKRGKKQLTS